MSVVVAQSRKEILRCYPVMSQLRTRLAEGEFFERVERQMRQGYHLAFLEEDSVVKCVAGFRLLEYLGWGKCMYVDDLVTDERERSKGYGQQLFAWLVEHAKANGCEQLHLDSGVHRYAAHRFYLAAGMDITCHHLAINLKT
jgi:GNAT superfamily N-acetyltransferase